MNTERDLIQRLTERLDHLHSNYDLPCQSALIAEALDYLDQPEPEGPTDEELLAIAIESELVASNGTNPFREDSDIEDEVMQFARTVLARWGRNTTKETL